MPETNLKLGSLFDGISGFPLVGSWYGIEPVWSSEIEPAPIRIAARHFPNMINHGDITKIHGGEIEPVDILTGGSPCFPTGTMILTDKGYIPIESVKVDDVVLTHTGNWKRVTATGHNDNKDIYELNAMGSLAIHATPNHPFLVTSRSKHSKTICGKREYYYDFTEPYKKRLDELTVGKDFLCSPILKTSENPYDLDAELCWLLGRYVADGHVTKSGIVILSIGHKKINHVNKINAQYKAYKHTKSCYHVEFSSDSRLAYFINKLDMSRYAIDKYIPMEILNLPNELLKAFIEGYMDGDGCYIKKRDYYQATTISKMLAITLQLAIQKVYRTACRIYFTQRPKKHIIEGRIVNQHDTYMVRYYINIKKQKNYYVTDDYILYPVEYIKNLSVKNTVYNITVEDDHTYIIPNCLVGNCQDMSTAGKQEGIKMKCEQCGTLVDFKETENSNLCPNCGAELTFTRSGLFMEQMRIIKEMRERTNECYPKVVIWENVSGALSSNDGDDFFCVLQEFCKLMGEKLPSFRPTSWSNSGEILGESGSIAWRLFDAQYWGVPQRRRRIFLVADFTGQRAGEILFKSESLRRHTASSKVPWKRTSSKIKEGFGDSSRNQSRDLIQKDISDDIVENAEPIMCVATQQTNAEIMLDKCPTLTAANGTSGSNKPFVVIDSEKPLAFEPGTSSRLGGHVWEDKAGTLTSQMGDNQMAVLTDEIPRKESVAYGICSLSSNSMKSNNPNSGIYETDVSKTLDTNGLNPICNQGGNVIVDGPVYCIQGNCIDRSDTAGCNGKGWREDVSFTLTTVDRPAVAYEEPESVLCVDQGDGKSACGVSEGVLPTLTCTHYGAPAVLCPNKNEPYVAAFAHQQGGSMPSLPYGEEVSPTLIRGQTMAVLIDNHGQDCRWREAKDNVCPTLSANMGMGGNNTPLVLENPPEVSDDITPYAESGFVTYGEGDVGTLRASGGHYGGGSETLLVSELEKPITATTGEFMQFNTDKAATLLSRDCNGPQIVLKPKSIVRRLTPLECERLQGFPDNWSESESDAARYKALGNSIALPCVNYIMSGIADVLYSE